MGWFDAPENSTGTLTTRLAVDASLVKGVGLFKKIILYHLMVLFYRPLVLV